MKKNSAIVLKKFHEEKIIYEVNNKTPIIICRNFLNKKVCKKIINFCVNHSSFDVNRKNKVNKFFDFHRIDVLPQKVQTSRIFRTFVLSKYTIDKFGETKKKILKLQKKILKFKKKKIISKFQVIHYPRGGGFLDWHSHPRYPTNYGLIITLSEKGRNFKEGVTKFKINNKLINLEKYSVSAGDLILFRFDLNHSISKVDPKENLTFDKNGRWTLVTTHEVFS